MDTITNPSARSNHHSLRNYALNPLIVYWEMTQACALACRHCRAEAMPCAHPQELTHAESKDLLRQIASFGDPLPHLILTGGDPLQRADLYKLIEEATSLGLDVSITPSATNRLTEQTIGRSKEHGIRSLGLSLDGSNATRHESVRGVAGCFESTIRAAQIAAGLGLPIQINTLVCQETADDLLAIYERLKTLNIMRWSLFFLIATGRGKTLLELAPAAADVLMNWIYEISQSAPFAIKTTEAPSYRRIALNRMRQESSPNEYQRRSLYQGLGIRDGNGIVFVSNTGDVYPSGFLPLAAGNVRNHPLRDLYRNAALFRSLRVPAQFNGKCGYCEYREVCGGSRARAFAHSGNALDSDPVCSFEPAHQSPARDHSALIEQSQSILPIPQKG
jgi:AdoMet-dependent heme synthase